MILKKPKKAPLGLQVVGGIIIFETALFGASYFIYRRLERSRGNEMLRT
jgi:hypothetical protein